MIYFSMRFGPGKFVVHVRRVLSSRINQQLLKAHFMGACSGVFVKGKNTVKSNHIYFILESKKVTILVEAAQKFRKINLAMGK